MIKYLFLISTLVLTNVKAFVFIIAVIIIRLIKFHTINRFHFTTLAV